MRIKFTVKEANVVYKRSEYYLEVEDNFEIDGSPEQNQFLLDKVNNQSILCMPLIYDEIKHQEVVEIALQGE